MLQLHELRSPVYRTHPRAPMDKIRTVIIDDDSIGRYYLRTLAARYPSLEILGEADGARSALDAIHTLRPEAIFLDVQMPDGTGLDLLRMLDYQPLVVFVTLSEAHALPAIDFDPVDYLLKPVTPERLASAVARLEKRVHAARALEGLEERRHMVSLKIGNETRLVASRDIAALTAEGNYTRVRLRDEAPVFVSVPLGRFVETLPSPPFIRLDRSLMINQYCLEKWSRLDKDNGLLWLHGTDQPLSLGRAAMERLRALA
jgi:two-component system LytT family response regulator